MHPVTMGALVNQDLMSYFIEGNLNPQLGSHSTFRVLDAPSLPLLRAAPNRMQFAGVGLFSGLLLGLALATAFRSRLPTSGS
jgi:hypothetical protein